MVNPLIKITTMTGALTAGDVITFAGVTRYHWLVRFAAWVTRTKLEPPRPREFVVGSWTNDETCDLYPSGAVPRATNREAP